MLSIRYFLFFICCYFLFPAFTYAQDIFTLLTWNVENLFDTIHQKNKNDYNFTPRGKNQWTSIRYKNKLNKLTKVLHLIQEDYGLDLIALCEVENDTTLQHLINRIANGRAFKYILTKGSDKRGVNVALLYRPLRFKLLEHNSLQIPTKKPTRDILYAKGVLPYGDTLHLFACHFPSKMGGEKRSLQNRLLATEVLLNHIKSIKELSPKAKIIVTGDFNDTPDSPIFQILTKNEYLTLLSSNLTASYHITGTYKYQQQWEQIDHFLISPSLASNATSWHTQKESCKIISYPFLLEDDLKGKGKKPKRCFKGTFYQSKGFSDHLPLLLILNRN